MSKREGSGGRKTVGKELDKREETRQGKKKRERRWRSRKSEYRERLEIEQFCFKHLPKTDQPFS